MAPVVAADSSGLAVSHVAGGSAGGLASAVAIAVANHFHLQLSDVDAAIVGSAALSLGVGLGHVVSAVGVFGAVKRLLRGKSA